MIIELGDFCVSIMLGLSLFIQRCCIKIEYASISKRLSSAITSVYNDTTEINVQIDLV